MQIKGVLFLKGGKWMCYIVSVFQFFFFKQSVIASLNALVFHNTQLPMAPLTCTNDRPEILLLL